MAVLAVIAVLAGASTLGGGLAVGGLITGRIAEVRAPVPVPSVEESAPAPSPTPTLEPAPEPIEEPTEKPSEPLDSDPWSMTADEVVEELREDYDLDSGLDLSNELCVAETEEDELFLCTMAVETNLVRVVSFDDPLVASTVVLGLLGQEESEEEGGAVDYRSACHIVLIWFEHAGMDEGERATMADDVEGIVGC